MMKGKAENLVVIIIILCSTSFFRFSALGSLQKVAELAGIGIIIIFILLYEAYADKTDIKKHFTIPITLIIFSFFTSVFMANYIHNQDFGNTIYVQRALFYYFFYILLHQMRIKLRDLEYIFYVFGIIHIVLYLIQYFVYPTIIFDGYVSEMRETIRIYLAGADYMLIAMFISVQKFFRTNQLKHMVFPLISLSIFILLGGRQTLAIVIFVIVLFLLIDRRVHSRYTIIILGIIGATALFFIFQPIFEALLVQTHSDAEKAEDYIRIRAAIFFLTDFMEHPMAYLLGNGTPYSSGYAREMHKFNIYWGYYIADLGLIGNYVLYGIFFVFGVIAICIKSLKIKIEDRYLYIKYIFIVVILSLITGGGFSKTDTICSIMLLLYILDVSHHSLKMHNTLKSTPVELKNHRRP